jgi:hypothetical protein
MKTCASQYPWMNNTVFSFNTYSKHIEGNDITPLHYISYYHKQHWIMLFNVLLAFNYTWQNTEVRVLTSSPSYCINSNDSLDPLRFVLSFPAELRLLSPASPPKICATFACFTISSAWKEIKYECAPKTITKITKAKKWRIQNHRQTGKHHPNIMMMKTDASH